MGSEDSNEMEMRRHTPAQVVRKLREADPILADGGGIAQVWQQFEVTEPTYYRLLDWGRSSHDAR